MDPLKQERDANGGLESASATVEAEKTLRKDENDSNGVDSSDSVELDGSIDAVQGVADKFLLHHLPPHSPTTTPTPQPPYVQPPPPPPTSDCSPSTN
ncbi:hypothetical protein L1887_00611 [Cichorium endivia]|nr:hypothetical protein L1887_00611 [Cichorium endivia]